MRAQGIDAARTVRHVVASAWIALVVIGAAAGVFALAGGQIAQALLGSSYASDVGDELGRLVVVLSLWAVVSVGVSVDVPARLRGRARAQRLPLIAVGAVVAAARSRVGGAGGCSVSTASRSRSRSRRQRCSRRCSSRSARSVRQHGGLALAALTVAAGTALAFVPSAPPLRRWRPPRSGLCFYAASSRRCGRPASVRLALPAGARVTRTPPVTAIVLSWNGREATLACLRSLDHVYLRAVLRPRRRQRLDRRERRRGRRAAPRCLLVRLPENLGFAGGMNAGSRSAFAAGADAVLLLNNDMEVDPGFVGPLVAPLAAIASAAAACAQILFSGTAGADLVRGRRSSRVAATTAAIRAMASRRCRLRRPVYETARACGGAMLVTAGTYERVGLFDEDLFAYAEDTDWSLRAQREGSTPCRPGERRPSRGLGLVGRRVVTGVALLRAAQLARRRGALGPLGLVGTWLAPPRGSRRVRRASPALAPSRRGSARGCDAWRDFRHAPARARPQAV